MCGICGKLNLDGAPVPESLIRGMASTLVHRGPDGEGVYAQGTVGLGHRRLAVIDLTPDAQQPMCNEDGTLWLVFNGEIYNFMRLREELVGKGHRFSSHSDTEVILHLYEEEGPDCVARLRGMFAFAIWDERARALFLARDRVGKKPLVYYRDERQFLFASEIKALLHDPAVPRKSDFTAIHHYLTYQCVPAPWTAFEGIQKLPPAHYMMVKDGQVDLKRYWTLNYLPKHSMNFDDLKRETVERLEEAVRIRLISDVPLGAFLSGGVDSSAVVALMSRIGGRPVKTFSIGFRQETYNELSYARIIAERFGTDHTEFTVEPDAIDVLPKLVWHYNEPFADSSAIPSYYVSKLAREHVTVALNGDGGDENFAGYGRYAANLLADRLRRVFPPALAAMALSVAMRAPHGGDPESFSWRLKRFLQGYVQSPELRNASWMSAFTPEMKKRLYTPGFAREVESEDSFSLMAAIYHRVKDLNSIDRFLVTDLEAYLPNDLLVKMDIASMASSLEARSPFLDHEFMEFVARIPAHYKLSGRTTKHILKESLREILPEQVLFRPKMGFGVPIDHWFRNELKEMAHDLLLGRRCLERGYFNRGYIERILNEHVTGKWNWQYHIFTLMMLELWHRTFLDECSRH